MPLPLKSETESIYYPAIIIFYAIKAAHTNFAPNHHPLESHPKNALELFKHNIQSFFLFSEKHVKGKSIRNSSKIFKKTQSP
jgi:hypothetical protein